MFENYDYSQLAAEKSRAKRSELTDNNTTLATTYGARLTH